MARNGYRIFDSDTHVGPDARILAGYLSEAERDQLRGLARVPARSKQLQPIRVAPLLPISSRPASRLEI